MSTTSRPTLQDLMRTIPDPEEATDDLPSEVGQVLREGLQKIDAKIYGPPSGDVKPLYVRLRDADEAAKSDPEQ